MDKVAAGFMDSVIVSLSICGMVWLVEIPLSTTLQDVQWHCTEVILKDGKPMCIKYERVKQ